MPPPPPHAESERELPIDVEPACARRVPRSLSSTLLPPPALGERRHGSLVRRLELWCAAAPKRQYLASLRSGLWDLLAND